MFLLLKVAPLWSGEGRQLPAPSHCSVGLGGEATHLAESASTGSQVSHEAVPFQGHCFIDRQIGIENHEFLQGVSLFLKGNKGEQRHIKNNESSLD